MNIIWEYIRYRWKAKGRHGTHSPFVYDFVDKCLRIPIDQKIHQQFTAYYQSLRASDVVLKITDLGAGSKLLSSERKVRDIAKVSGTHNSYAKLLYRVAKYYQPKSALELGTSLGLGTFMIAQGNPEGKLITVEGCPETFQFTKHQLSALENVSFVNSTFTDFLSKNSETFDLVFIDGDHRGASVLQLLELLKTSTHDETLFIIDDIRWSDDMLKAWKSLEINPDYHLTMDLFRMGIVARRSHQEKEHFIIKV
jgi:predicted O-methyltransferase YrrM